MRRISNARTAASILLALAAAGTASAAKLRVPQDFATIDAAIDAANAGDVIVIAAGSYPEDVVVDQADITIVGKGKVIIEPPGITYGVRVAFTTGVTLKNLTVRGADIAGIILENSDGCTVERCRVEDSQGAGIQVVADLARIRDTLVRDCAERGIRVLGDGALLSGIRVRDCGAEGIEVLGDQTVVEDCDVRRAELGIHVGGVANLVERATVRDVATFGIELFGGDNGSVFDGDVRGAAAGIVLDEITDVAAMDCSVGDTIGLGFRPLDCVGGVFSGIHVTRAHAGISSSGSSLLVLHAARATRCVDDGCVLGGGEDNVVRSGRFLRNGGRGLAIGCSDSLIAGNVAKQNGTFDHDDAGVNNVYVDNVFGTVAP